MIPNETLSIDDTSRRLTVVEGHKQILANDHSRQILDEVAMY
jgi:hypothetical protein